MKMKEKKVVGEKTKHNLHIKSVYKKKKKSFRSYYLCLTGIFIIVRREPPKNYTYLPNAFFARLITLLS
jgi:hypothetical protein